MDVSSMLLTAVKSVVLAPMPSASESTTTVVQPLAFHNMRTAWRRSFNISRLPS